MFLHPSAPYFRALLYHFSINLPHLSLRRLDSPAKLRVVGYRRGIVVHEKRLVKSSIPESFDKGADLPDYYSNITDFFIDAQFLLAEG